MHLFLSASRRLTAPQTLCLSFAGESLVETTLLLFLLLCLIVKGDAIDILAKQNYKDRSRASKQIVAAYVYLPHKGVKMSCELHI